jgi:hypothetical protein
VERVEAETADAEEPDLGADARLEALRRELAESERERQQLALEIRVRTAEGESLRKAVAEERGRVERQSEMLDRLRETTGKRDRQGGRWRGEMEKRLAEREEQKNKLRKQLAATNARLHKSARERKRLAAELRSRRQELRTANRRLDAAGRQLETVRADTAALYLGALPRHRLRTALRLAGWSARLRFRDVRAYLAIRRSGQFDVRHYLTAYPEVVVAGENPIVDYLERGAAEGRDPRADFDTRRYVELHPELADTGENPFLHYLRSAAGAAAGAEPLP